MRSPFDPGPRLFPLLLVVAAVILVPAIAFASTPDPFWLEGVYDDADGDDLLSLVDDIVATEAACLPHTSPPHLYKAAFALRPSMTSSHAANRFTRGPPLRQVHMRSRLPYPASPCTFPSPREPHEQTRYKKSAGITSSLHIALLDQPMSSRASGRDRQQLAASSTRTKVRSNSQLLTEGGCHGQEDESRHQNRA